MSSMNETREGCFWEIATDGYEHRQGNQEETQLGKNYKEQQRRCYSERKVSLREIFEV